MAPAFYHRENVAFGFVNTLDSASGALITKYNINKYRETLLMFNEETNTPVATVSVSIRGMVKFAVEAVLSKKILPLLSLKNYPKMKEFSPLAVLNPKKLLVFAISVDLDDTVHERLSYQDLHCVLL